jgi:mannobiose 2-epimerase
LEAYTELYNVWKSPELQSRLKNILFLIRDVQTTKEGYLNLFF